MNPESNDPGPPAHCFAVGDDIAEALRRGLLIGTAVLVLVLQPSGPPSTSGASSGARANGRLFASGQVSDALRPLRPASVGGATALSNEAHRLADWVADSADNVGAPFVVVDKRAARLHVFDAEARWVDSTPVLVGSALGDDSVPGIGTRPIPLVRPEERTTPAGRFDAFLGHNTLGEDVVWVDYGAAVSMHRVRLTNPSEQRQERLDTPEIDDNRVSYGCINVPETFYDARIRPLFAARRHAAVYVLPDLKTLAEAFGIQAGVAGRAVPSGSSDERWVGTPADTVRPTF